jgi:hypothetical protein
MINRTRHLFVTAMKIQILISKEYKWSVAISTFIAIITLKGLLKRKEFVASLNIVFQLDFEIFRTIASFIKISSGHFIIIKQIFMKFFRTI